MDNPVNQRYKLERALRILLALVVLWVSPAALANPPPLLIDLVVADSFETLPPLTNRLKRQIQTHFPDSQLRVVRVSESATASAQHIAIAISDPSFVQLNQQPHRYQHVIGFYISRDNFKPYAGNDRYSAILHNPNTYRQLALGKALIPNLQRVGLLYSDREELQRWQQAANELQLELVAEAVTPKSDIYALFNQVLMRSDVMMGTIDPSIYNGDTIRNLLLSSYRHRKALLGPNKTFVRAGALASTFSDVEQFMEQLTDNLQQLKNRRQLPPAEYPSQYLVIINDSVAKSLGLKEQTTDQLLKRIEEQLEQPH